ncbi:MAG: radical SAM protein [Pirellulales bacterium]|nr:radical SAM protein [Pirellulales bacterium]
MTTTVAPRGAGVLEIAEIVPVTEAEGPGRRFALWVQGCPLRCPGCCNPEMLPLDRGKSVSVDELLLEIGVWKRLHDIEGITLLGGEPFAQAAGLAVVARMVREQGLTVMTFSGYTLEELEQMFDPAVDELLRHTDVLVDGPYLRQQPETRRRWIGSANQRVHFLSDRYRADDPCWQLPNSLEIRLRGNELSVNGFPAPKAGRMWTRLRPMPGWRS